MSIPWGPALDAELSYRHQQVRSGLQRGRTWPGKPARHLPAERVAAAPLIPLQPNPLNREVASRGLQREASGSGRDRADAHAA